MIWSSCQGTGAFLAHVNLLAFDFFLEGVATIADEAVASARDLSSLVATDRARLLGLETASVSALRLFEHLPRHPIVTVGSAVKLFDARKPTVTRAIEVLAAAGILVETTGKRRDRSFAYRAYMDRLRAGTELKARRRVGMAGRGCCPSSRPLNVV